MYVSIIYIEPFITVIMPPSALDVLTRLNIVYPMLFKLTNRRANRNTHCGVLEFVADEGKVYIPYWVSCMQLICKLILKKIHEQ